MFQTQLEATCPITNALVLPDTEGRVPHQSNVVVVLAKRTSARFWRNEANPGFGETKPSSAKKEG
jgi:hypothetical protein